METEKKNHDFDTFHKRPAAWRRVKEAIADHFDLALIFRRLERITGEGSVRLHFAFALHAYNRMTPAERVKAMEDYFAWSSMIEGKAGDFHKVPPRPAPAAESLQEPGWTLYADRGHYQYWTGPGAKDFYFGERGVNCIFRCGPVVGRLPGHERTPIFRLAQVA